MRNLLLTIAYCGKNLHGWQIQDNALTVQEVFQDALFQIIHEHPDIKGCSRTDSGVHANMYCVSMRIEHPITNDHLMMAMLLSGEEEYKDIDMNRVIRMCLIHDLGESFTGDIPTFEKSDEDTQTEDSLFDQWVDSFPAAQREEGSGLLAEMGELKTREAKLYKAMDKLEALISHNESDIATWLPIEYGLQLTYGQENMEFSPYLKEIRAHVDDWTRDKIAKEGGET